MKALTRSKAGLAVTSCLALTLATPGLAHAGSSPSRHVLGHAPTWTSRAHHVGRLSGATQQDLSFVLNLRDADARPVRALPHRRAVASPVRPHRRAGPRGLGLVAVQRFPFFLMIRRPP